MWLNAICCRIHLEKRRPRRQGNASHNLSRYVLPTRACGSRPSLSLPLVAICCRSRLGVAYKLIPTWVSSLNFLMATPKRLRQQIASETSESDGREPRARVGSTYLLRLCDALPCLRGLRFFPNKDRSKSLQPRLRKFQKSS